jgi:protocatechuate 3,4-dioxygenase alpha subunit
MHNTATASQTIGPFWHLLADPAWSDLTRFGADGAAITIAGTVRDGAGAPVTDACVELFQADPPPRPDFRGFGRCATDERGRYRFVTVKPGPILQGGSWQAPHLSLVLFARGLLHHLTTRLYFPDDASNAADTVLSAVDAKRRNTLLATQSGEGRWIFDIVLQGDAETVFLVG